MDVRIMFTTFLAVLMAEVADKTQLVGVGLSAKTGRPLSVFVGSVLAYALITAVSVLAGAFFAKHINPLYLRYAGGALFIILGSLMLSGRV